MSEHKTIQDKTMNAVERVVNHAIKDGAVNAYLCTLQLPRQFSNNQHQANDIYKKIISDFGKNIYRKTGETPRYVTVKTENKENPEYAFCLLTRHDASLDNPEDYAEKGREIANSKVGQAGWGNGRLDLMELLNDAPRFKIASNPIQISDEKKADAIERIKSHLNEKGKAESTQLHQRCLFVSKVKI